MKREAVHIADEDEAEETQVLWDTFRHAVSKRTLAMKA